MADEEVSERAKEIIQLLCEHRDAEALVMLKAEPELINGINEYGQTPFWSCAYYDRRDLIRQLLEPQFAEIADYTRPDIYNRDALFIASKLGNEELVDTIQHLFNYKIVSIEHDRLDDGPY